jgi:alpha-L-fucosidase
MINRSLRCVAVAVAVWSIAALALNPPTPASAADQVAPEAKEQHDRRMQWWRDARFGMFIHWGVYAVPAGEFNGIRSRRGGEWIMEWANIPRATYETLLPQFNPVKFDAAEWVRIAKDAGMKYLVITAKHHDGFSMYDSKVSPYDIVDSTPYKKDPMKDLAAECKKQGLKFCFYYSILDWHHPTAYVEAQGKDPMAGNRLTKLNPGGKEEYVMYMKEQLRELVTGYDPAVLWFDGEWQDWWTQDDGKDLYAYVRSLKPDIIINNRVGKSRKGMEGVNKSGEEAVGDFGTPEQRIPAGGLPGVDWESCMTLNGTWGYKSYDDQWKSTETLVRNLIDIASKGGNYLLNVGPTASGEIPPESIERLIGMGQWMKAYGASIYRTKASPFSEPLKFGRATSSPTAVYLFVFDWPTDGKLQTPKLDRKVKAASIMPAAESRIDRAAKETDPTVRVSRMLELLSFTQNDSGVTIDLPAKTPDPIASVIVLDTNE